jgi:CheY-like chemotaxis protein
VLADSGYRVTTALGGQEALDLLHQKPFDLVLTDLNMPGVDGIAVLRSAKGTDANIKVVVMTGSALPSSTLRLIVGEANGFLQKPFTLTELHRTIASCLSTEILQDGFSRQTPPESAEALPP